jgi:hypothetical protein
MRIRQTTACWRKTKALAAACAVLSVPLALGVLSCPPALGAGMRPPEMPPTETVSPAQMQSEADPVELLFWESIKDSTNPAEYRAYLEQYPNGSFVRLARIRAESSGQSGAGQSEANISGTSDLSQSNPPEPPEQPPVGKAQADEEPPHYAAGDHVEGLSRKGWQAATVVDQDARGVRVKYEDSSLPEEQLDARLVRSVAGPTGGTAETAAAQPGTGVDGPAVSEAAKGGSSAAADQVAPGTYSCEVQFTALQNSSVVTGSGEGGYDIKIFADGRYQAFAGEEGRFTYDPARQTVRWDSGALTGIDTHYEGGGKAERLTLAQFPAPGDSTCTRQ